MSSTEENAAQVAPDMIYAAQPQVVNEAYLQATEQRLLAERAKAEQQLQSFMAGNDLALNVIRLARLGLAASEGEEQSNA